MKARPQRVQAVAPGERSASRSLVATVALALGVGLIAGLLPELRSAWRAVRDATPPATEPVRALPRVALPEPPPAVAQELAVPANSKGALSEVPNLSSEGMEVELGPGGQVLVTSKYAIQRLGAGNPHDRRVLFTPRLYLSQFSGRRPQAMASALALPGERYLFGGWHGEVLLLEAGNLVRIAGDAERPRGRIADLQRWDDRVLLAGDGLWELSDDLRRLREIPLPGIGTLRAIAPAAGFVLLGASRSVYSWNGTHLERWLDLPGEGHLEMIAPAAGGGWWIGTTRGLWWTSVSAEQSELVLPGVWTTAVVERPGELWVGAWKQGLLLRRGERWYRMGADEEDLPLDSVSGFLVDPADHAWLTLYGGGGWHAPLAALREQMLTSPWTPRADP